MRYYARTLAGMGLVFLALAAAALLANAGAAEARAKHARLVESTQTDRSERNQQKAKVTRLGESVGPMRRFAAAWKEFVTLPEKEAAEGIRSEIETIAQRQLGLVTDNALTPHPERYTFQAQTFAVQRVALRVSGRDLTSLLTWLGKVEERFPAALVELCEFSSNVGGSTGLTIRLVQPVADAAAPRTLAAVAAPDVLQLNETIGGVPWLAYLPARLKTPVAVGFQRNPLQPAVAGDSQQIPLLRDDSDEIAPRLELALDGRLRSVIRGSSPLIVVDGRIFRVGDELLVGAREKPIASAKTRLKHIGDERLVFQVAGGTAEKPIQCEVSYALPAFLKAR